LFDSLDTKYLTGDIPTDVQFIEDALSIDDAEFFRRAMANIMSEGSARIDLLTGEELNSYDETSK
jgi:hypothetical protein